METTTEELATHLQAAVGLPFTTTGTGSSSVIVQQGDVTFSGGGSGFLVESTATSVVAQLQADTAIMERINATGSGATVLAGLASTPLSGGTARASVSTASQVVTAIQGISASPLTAAVTGSSSAIVNPAQVDLSGAVDTLSISTVDEVVSLINGTPAIAALLTATGSGSTVVQASSSAQSLSGGGIQSTPTGTTTYVWDVIGRLDGVTMPSGQQHDYEYDYRTRRIGLSQSVHESQAAKHTAVVFSGGLSLAEYESETKQTTLSSPGASTVRYVRGPDMGGGVGGLLYSHRAGASKYNLSNGRGDIVAQSDGSGELTWTASYEAYGKRTKETGTNADKQRANSKDEDPTGLLNEGFRYRDIETGVWLSRDPAGFVDGPNLYAYVQQNPWSCFDPKGLRKEWHHDLPKDLEVRFKKYDIDVHDSKNGSFLDAEKHNQLHSKGKYNQHWSNFLNEMDNITDSAKARSEILKHMEDIRGGKVDDFAGYYKDAVRVGEGLNYNTHGHFKNGTLSPKQRGQVITAALDAAKMGTGIAFDVGKQFGRKLPIVKYAMGGLAFSAGQSFAKETLGMSDSSARMVGFIEALNPAPLGVQDLYELGQDDLQLQAGRRQADIDNIGRTGYPLYMTWNRFNTEDPPQEWTQNPQEHMPELIQHWGR